MTGSTNEALGIGVKNLILSYFLSAVMDHC
jgi:hypothetical protein